MSHKTLVNGTVYEVGGGKTLIDGVAYSIDKGKTLVGGTAYEVGFAPSEATVTITGSGGNANMVWVTINGEDYREASSVNVPIGTVITCNPYGSVILNGQTVANGKPITYDYTVTKNVTINLNWRQGTGTITITET